MSTLAIAMLAILGQAPAAPQETVIEHCIVSLIEQAQVPAEEAGALREIFAVEGDRVTKGEKLAQIDDRNALAKLHIAQQELAAAQKESSNDVKVRAASAEAMVSENQYLQGADLPIEQREGELSERLLRRLLLAPHRAELQQGVAELDHTLAGLRSNISQAQVEDAKLGVTQRSITAPMSGVVVQSYRHIGEWVKPGDAVMHIVRMDHLRIEGYVPAAAFSPQEVLGKPVTVKVHLARGKVKTLQAKIDYASPLVETSGGYRVWAIVENEETNGYWSISPGLTASMTIRVK